MAFTEYDLVSSMNQDGELCVRRTDGSGVRRLGDGYVADLSPDGRWLAAVRTVTPNQLWIHPTGPGDRRQLATDGLSTLQFSGVNFFPDGNQLVICGEDGHVNRCVLLDRDHGETTRIGPDGLLNAIPSPDGKRLAAKRSDDSFVLVNVEGGQVHVFGKARPNETLLRWTADGKSVLAAVFPSDSLQIDRLDITTGDRARLREFTTSERRGRAVVTTPAVNADLSVWSYVDVVRQAQLFLARPPEVVR
jgi:Tol biopolymer transport system component